MQNSGYNARGGGGRSYPSKDYQSGQHTPQPFNLAFPDLNDPELLGNKAEKLANDIVNSGDLSKSQLRNFYGEVKNIERLLDTKPDKNQAWQELYPRIKLIKAKAVYNASRKLNKIPPGYLEFLKQGVDKIDHNYDKGIRTFKTFCQLFEAVVGYSSPRTQKE